MQLTPENIKRLDKIFDAFNDGNVKSEELVAAVDSLIDVMNKGRAELQDALSQLDGRTRGDLDRLTAELRTRDGEGRAATSQALDSLKATYERELAAMRDSLRDEVARVQALIPELPPEFDATDIRTALQGHQEALDSLAVLTTGENVRNALEALPEGDKLAIEAIEGLRKELDELKARKQVIQGGIVGRDIIKKYDLSPYLDGVTKTFNLPSTWAVISVACSSFPNVLRPVIDYTNTSTSITFTSEIEASTTLAAGQTVVLILVTG